MPSPTDTTMQPFSLPQTVFMLSLGSNYLFDKTGDDAELLAKIMEYLGGSGADATPGEFFQILNTPHAAYQCLACPANSSGADWKTAWGPAVFKASENAGATNAVFVAHSAKLNTYVVAIAGTNPTGTNALLFQDLDVNPAHMVAWPPKVNAQHKLEWTNTPLPKSDAALAKGTSDGLSNLYELQSNKITLEAFLKSAEKKSDTLIFTGHSLGGALSPMLALLLYPNPSSSGWGNIHILATAGPTPGNQGLAQVFANTYPRTAIPAYTPAGKQGSFALFTDWNVNYANKCDLVPRAWDRLDGVETLPPRGSDRWGWFSAEGATLGPVLGAAVKKTMADMEGRAGYNGSTTPYYAPALQQVIFAGQWGSWEKEEEKDTPNYPPQWITASPPSELNTDQLSDSILDAHLAHYPYAFLGANAP